MFFSQTHLTGHYPDAPRDLLKKPILGMRDRLEEIEGNIRTIRLKFRTQEVDARALGVTPNLSYSLSWLTDRVFTAKTYRGQRCARGILPLIQIRPVPT